MNSAKLLLVAVPIVSLAFMSKGCSLTGKNPNVPGPNAIPYTILDDYMGTNIKIGVASSVTEGELRATLERAADEHQDDAARDYLVSMYLWVDAYLVSDNQASTIPAGTLRRYVPGGNPAERRKLTIDRRKDDRFTITLDEARKTVH